MSLETPSSTLRIKSYFTASVEEAIQQARRDLGPEAMLLNSRKAVGAGRQAGEYEVTFAVGPPDPAPAPDEPALPEPPPPPAVMRQRVSIKPSLPQPPEDLPPAPAGRSAPEPVPDLMAAVAELRDLIHGAVWASPAEFAAVPGLATLYGDLIRAEIPAPLCRDLLNSLRGELPASSPRDLLRRELTQRLPAGDPSRWTTPGFLPAAFVGPPGAGKTLALIRVALLYGLRAGRPVEILAVETHRVGSSELLRHYAAVLGIPCRIFDSAEALTAGLQMASEDGLVLIDTPGYTRTEYAMATDLACFCRQTASLHVELVVPASLRPAALGRTIDRFAAFEPDALLFTRLDEVNTYGSLWYESFRTGKPISFLGTGQRVPEDLIVATPARLAGLLIHSLAADGAPPPAD